MKTTRTQVIWISGNGSGKVCSFMVSPCILRILLFVLILCVCAVPLLETGLIALAREVQGLQEKRQNLASEVLTLQYLRKALGQISEKESMLRNYYGMEKYDSLDQVMGIGGRPFPNFEKEGPAGHEKGKGDLVLPLRLRRLGANMETLEMLTARQGDAWAGTPSIIPVDLKNPRISSGFGRRKSPFTGRGEFHAGIDIMGPKGTKVVAPAGGKVIAGGHDRWLGNYLVLKHGEDIKTVYGHLEEKSVRRGMEVKRGDLLGLMGNTGLSTSRHLHYGVMIRNRAVDPMQYILDVRGQS